MPGKEMHPDLAVRVEARGEFAPHEESGSKEVDVRHGGRRKERHLEQVFHFFGGIDWDSEQYRIAAWTATGRS
jgi:hypothetical protein